jgi:hypothetical protein
MEGGEEGAPGDSVEDVADGKENAIRHASAFAEAWFPNETTEDTRHESSLYRGSAAIKQKNQARHLTKQRTCSKFHGDFVHAAAKAHLEQNWVDSVAEGADIEVGEDSEKGDQDNAIEGGKSTNATCDRQEITPPVKPIPANQPISNKARAKTYNGRRLSAGIVIPEKKHKSLDMDDFEVAEPTLFKQLRQMYASGHEDIELDEMDEELYTDLALLQREAIRFEPAVQLVIAELFEAIDEDRSQLIDEHEYRKYINALYECLQMFWDPEMEEKSDKQMKEIADEDWTVDCGGHPKINYDRFVVAMFKLCDVWTDFVDGESYLDFLVALRDRMTILGVVDGEVKRILRSGKRSIKRDAAVTQRDKVTLIVKSMYSKDLKRWTHNPQLVS